MGPTTKFRGIAHCYYCKWLLLLPLLLLWLWFWSLLLNTFCYPLLRQYRNRFWIFLEWFHGCNTKTLGFHHDDWSQELPPLDYFFQSQSGWNKLHAVPKHKWLAHTRTDTDKSRFQALGNIVVPQQAFLSVATLFRMAQGQISFQKSCWLTLDTSNLGRGLANPQKQAWWLISSISHNIIASWTLETILSVFYGQSRSNLNLLGQVLQLQCAAGLMPAKFMQKVYFMFWRRKMRN